MAIIPMDRPLDSATRRCHKMVEVDLPSCLESYGFTMEKPMGKTHHLSTIKPFCPGYLDGILAILNWSVKLGSNPESWWKNVNLKHHVTSTCNGQSCSFSRRSWVTGLKISTIIGCLVNVQTPIEVCLKIAIFPPTKSCRFIGTFSWLTMGDGWLKNMFDVQIISNPSFFTMNTIHMYI